MEIGKILYFEIFSHEVEMHTCDSKIYCFQKRLRDLEQELPPCFIRNHRSIIVNINHVFAIKKSTLELDNSHELPITESRRKALSEAFFKYHVR